MRRRFGPLDRNQRIACAGVDERDVSAFRSGLTLDPCPSPGHAPGVDDEQVVLVREPIDEHVVDERAFGCRERRILRLADRQPRRVVGRDPLHERKGVGAGHLDLTHVADIEESRTGSNGHVLVGDAGVLDGHVPSGEVDHTGAAGDVHRVERGLTEFGWRARRHWWQVRRSRSRQCAGPVNVLSASLAGQGRRAGGVHLRQEQRRRSAMPARYQCLRYLISSIHGHVACHWLNDCPKTSRALFVTR